jgi:hypothetical protein
VAWCSFLAASVATMVFFAIVDPAPFADASRRWLEPDDALQPRLPFLLGDLRRRVRRPPSC